MKKVFEKARRIIGVKCPFFFVLCSFVIEEGNTSEIAHTPSCGVALETITVVRCFHELTLPLIASVGRVPSVSRQNVEAIWGWCRTLIDGFPGF